MTGVLNDNIDCHLDAEHDYLIDLMEIMILSNYQHFDQDDYESESPIRGASIIDFFRMPTRSIRHKFRIQQHALEREDNIVMAIPGLSEIEESYFTIEKEDIETRTSAVRHRLEFVYSLSLDRIRDYRRVMTLAEAEN